MIASLNGRIMALQSGSIEIDVGGVGYLVHVPSQIPVQVKVGDEMRLFTHLVVREDAMTLFGFVSPEDRNAFQVLTGVTGVGGKLALSVLSSLGSDGLRRAVVSQDVALLTEVPGIGKRGAERILMELKERLGAISTRPATSSAAEVREALIGLGYTPAELRDVLERMNGDEPVEELLRSALKELSRT